jgi:hypothetical protein
VMPKEIVYNSEQFSDAAIASMVELHWGRESFVQLATTLRDVSTHDPITREVEAGWFINLNRSGINKLIRDLRKARDQAFGADE